MALSGNGRPPLPFHLTADSFKCRRQSGGMSWPSKVAPVRCGPVAVDQHLPVIDKSPDFEARRHASRPAASAIAACRCSRPRPSSTRPMPEVKLVAICTPPGVRHAYVREAIDAGKDVLLEKPPTPTITEFDDLVAYGEKKGRVLFQTWHSRYNAAVDAAKTDPQGRRRRLARASTGARASASGTPARNGCGSPAASASAIPASTRMSIFTKIMPFPVFVEAATLKFPANRQTPVDVEIVFKSDEKHQPKSGAGLQLARGVRRDLDHRDRDHEGDGLKLERGGTVLRVNGKTIENPFEEYEQIYERFASS